MLGKYLENVREKNPLIHNITNYVTVNDCANILLACSASPIMADDCGEVEEIASICGGLNINIGTLNKDTIPAMFLAGKRANALGHPVILDPVGAGASKLRTDTAKKLLGELKLTVIRGNISEIKALAAGTGSTKGVDADAADIVTEETLESTIAFAKKFSGATGAVIAITGATDIVASADRAFVITNGHPMMARITGSGCMLTAMTAAYITASPENVLEAAAASVCAMGICGEKAFETTAKNHAGNSSFRNFLIDEIYRLDGAALDRSARYRIV
ncbi:MAG: hydroxyethylthiazole kinase [Oscillospiraceae bacterium]|nr:hydroxyethylthiazole kinase [Oscillospiraceae bacterium]